MVFQSLLIPGMATMVQVTASANGMLDAWCDFNGDGAVDAADLLAMANNWTRELN